MSDREFESYLGLLSRFLRLSRRQREDIRRELRAHLEDALDDYLAQGLTRDAAVLRALEDFGDAAELAARFRAIGRTRRWIMRTTATAAGIGIVALTASYFGSGPATPARAGLKPATLLQADAPRDGVPRALDAAGADAADENNRVLTALRKPIPEIAFEQTPFEEVIDFIADANGINIVVQWGMLEEYGIARDHAVRLKLKHVSAERMLPIVLDAVGQGLTTLSYQVKDGILFISTAESLRRDLVTRVYDVRDLLTAGLDWQQTKERLRGPNPGTPVPGAPPANSPGAGSGPAPAPPGSGATSPTAGSRAPAQRSTGPADELNWPENALVSVINETIEPDAWTTGGGAGTAAIYNGVLIIRQHEQVHADVEKLLLMLRDAGAAGERPGVASR